MPNYIKYSASAQTKALKKDNFWIGVGDVEKGPTSTTDYWSGIAPPAGGYTVYQNKVSNGPSINVPSSDANLISLTNKLAGASYTTVAQCMTWFRGQSDKMVVDRDYEAIVTSDLILNLDAGFAPSYPRSGNSWYDLSPANQTVTLTNGPYYAAANGGIFRFDGIDDYADITMNQLTSNLITVTGFMRWNSFTGGMFFGFTTYDIWTTGNAMGFNTGNGDLYGIPSSTVTSLGLSGNWAHYAFVMIGSGNIPANNKIYINGNLQSLGQQYSTTTNGNGFSNLRLSGWLNSTNYVNNLDFGTFQVYNRELSVNEIKQNFNAQKARYGL